MNETPDIHVLHVDDDPEFVEVTAEILERENGQFNVETATSASDGLDRLAENDLNCVVSDYQMPDQNGIEFLKTVRDAHPELPFILFTGRGSEKIASEAISAGVTDYLQKQTGSGQYQLLARQITNAVEHQRAKTAYRELFKNVPDGIVIHEPEEGTVVDINNNFSDMYGYDRDELLEFGFEVIHLEEPPYTVENARRKIQQAVSVGPLTFEWPGVKKGGERFWTEVHLSPARIQGVDRVLAVVRDITPPRYRARAGCCGR